MDRFDFDDEYVRRLLAGDREVEDHFNDYFNHVMLLKLRSRLRTMEDIDEVRQETFMRVWKGLPGLREGSKLGSFVLKTCENVLMEYIRKNKRADRDHTDVAGDVGTDPDEVLDHLIQAEDEKRVQRLLDRMKPSESAVLRAHFFHDMAPADICAKYDIKPHNFRVRLYRAKKKFRELCERKSTPPFTTSMISVTLGRLWSLWL